MISDNRMNLHANNMANSVVDERAVTSNRIFETFLRIQVGPTRQSGAWIDTKIPISFS